MQADTYIPRRLDDQWKIGFWDVDVAAPLLFALATLAGFVLAVGPLAAPRGKPPPERVVCSTRDRNLYVSQADNSRP